MSKSAKSKEQGKARHETILEGKEEAHVCCHTLCPDKETFATYVSKLPYC
jgi:hypothetical protein